MNGKKNRIKYLARNIHATILLGMFQLNTERNLIDYYIVIYAKSKANKSVLHQ